MNRVVVEARKVTLPQYCLSKVGVGEGLLVCLHKSQSFCIKLPFRDRGEVKKEKKCAQRFFRHKTK